MAQMTAVQASGPGSEFETVTRAVPEPGANTVRIKVQACGVCHSDAFVKKGLPDQVTRYRPQIPAGNHDKTGKRSIEETSSGGSHHTRTA